MDPKNLVLKLFSISYSGKSIGNDLRIEIEALIQEPIRYIEETDDGFLKVIMEVGEQSLPAFLKVKFERREKRRDYFMILEGLNQGKNASVKIKPNTSSYLHLSSLHTGPIQATYSRATKLLTIENKKYKTIDYPKEPWKKGFYDIEIPDAPHEPSRPYLDRAPKALVWFRIGHHGKKYIHTGQRTLGCITLVEHEKWDEAYQILIKARKGDLRSVGTLEVIDY